MCIIKYYKFGLIMHNRIASKYEVYSIDVGDFFHKENDCIKLIYSPLARNVQLITADEYDELAKSLNNNPESTSVSDETKAFIAYKWSKGSKLVSSPEQYTELRLVVNYDCNFTCSYCYSSQGRSKKRLTHKQIEIILQSFFSLDNPRKHRHISFIGGGEPLLALSLLKYTVRLAQALAKEKDIDISFSVITNGSILNDEVVDFFKTYKFKVSVSFEILEDIQNLQRMMYFRVAENLDTLCKCNIIPFIRSTITQNNVYLQSKMIKTIKDRFPQIKWLQFEPITCPMLLKDEASARLFLKSYKDNFTEAKYFANEYGISLNCSFLRYTNSFCERACMGEMVVTPEGAISICHRITSPMEPHYHDFIYGNIYQNGIVFDRKAFGQLIGKNIYNDERCRDCFAKYNCGGHCLAQQYAYSKEVLIEVCNMKRSFLKDALLDRLEKHFIENMNLPLKSYFDSWYADTYRKKLSSSDEK